MHRTEICRGFTSEQWDGLKKRLVDGTGRLRGDEAAWQCAVRVFERRIRERFLSCIEALQEDDSKLDTDARPNPPPDCTTLPEDVGVRAVVPGFAIMALCCLLMETLQSFSPKVQAVAKPAGPCPYPNGKCIWPEPGTATMLKSFLKRPAFGDAFKSDRIAASFVKGIRNGILHQAETRRWVIWREQPKGKIAVEHEGHFVVNRTAFL